MFAHRPTALGLLFALAIGPLLPTAAVHAEKPLPPFVDVPAEARVTFRPTPAEAGLPREFRLPRDAFEARAASVSTIGAVRWYDVEFPSPVRTPHETNNVVHARYFQPSGKGPFPACVVLHELDGQFWMIHTISDLLARRGVATLAIQMPYYGKRRDPKSSRRMVSFDPRRTVESVRQAVLDTRRSAAWLAARPEVDGDRLGLVGVSLGGFVAVTAAAVEPKFGRVAVVLAGGDVAGMIWSHTARPAKLFRERWTAVGGTEESLRRQLRPVEPTTHASRLKDRRILMIAAKSDEIVPRPATDALYAALGERPELVWLDAGHITAALYLPREVDRIGRFLNGKDEQLGSAD